MSPIIHYLLALISFITISLSQLIYEDSICNGSRIDTFVADSNTITSLTGIPDSIVSNSLPYTITNAPNTTPPDSGTPQLVASAVDPISGELYLLLTVSNDVDGAVPYLGTVDRSTQQITIIYPTLATPPNTAVIFVSLTFDCMGNLFALDINGRPSTYKIEINNLNETNATLIDSGINNVRIGACGQFCPATGDSISYHWEEEKLYRISSHEANQKHLLFVRDAISGGMETEYNISDPNGYCFDGESSGEKKGAIVGSEYIGNNLFLISCQNTQDSIRLLDVSNINTPLITDIGSNEILTIDAIRGIIPSDNNDNICIPPATCVPTTQPTSNPTTTPSQSPTETTMCRDKCDAFSVIVDEYDITDRIICIDYTVTRLSDESPLCDKDIRYFILGLCDSDRGIGIDSEDWNGIIQSFNIISNNRRNLGHRHRSSSSNGYRVVSGSRNGIKVNIRVTNELKFELCMTNIFEEPIEFSNTIGFRRGSDRFVCDNNDDIFDGLPCVNDTKFSSDSYDSSGYNDRYRNINRGGRRRRSFSESGERAMLNEELTNNNNWGVLSELDPSIRYTLISIFIVSGILVSVAAYICICRKNKKGNDTNDIDDIQNELGNVIKENRDGTDGNKNKNKNTTVCVSSDDEIVTTNE